MTTTTPSPDATTAYTDGACIGNPGPGGWAWAVPGGAFASGSAAATTNQRMEVQAALEAIRAIEGPLRIVSDSKYVVDCFNQRWYDGWERRDWKNAKKEPVKNQDLWKPLIGLYLARRDEITFEWVKGHSGDPRNERVDAASNAAATRAYATSEAQRAVERPADEWVLALCSPAGRRPVQWALDTPIGRRAGTRVVAGATEPTAVYQALVDALEAARQLAGGARVALVVISNYELIVKQGRGEWKVKQPAQQELAARAARIREEIGDVRFDFAPTDAVLRLIEQASPE